MKIKYSHTVYATPPHGIQRKYCPISATHILMVAAEVFTRTDFNFTIVNAATGASATGSVPHPFGTSESIHQGMWALARLRDGVGILLWSNYMCTIYSNGAFTGWEMIGGASVDPISGTFQVEDGPAYFLLGEPAVAATDGAGRLHVLTEGQGLVRAIINPDGSVYEEWTILDQPSWSSISGTSNHNYFYDRRVPPIFKGGLLVWIADVSLEYSSSLRRLVTVDSSGGIGYGQPVSSGVFLFEGSIGEATLGGAGFIDTNNRNFYNFTPGGVTPHAVNYGENWWGVGGSSPQSWVCPGEKALAPIAAYINGTSNPPWWGYGDSSGKTWFVENLATLTSPSGNFVNLGKLLIHQTSPSSDAFYVMEWAPNGGMVSLRQRQTLAGNTASWPLRQRQNGGANGSWPLRQRQNH